MAKKPNQKLRLLYLMKILSEQTDENHALTVKELSDRLEKYEIPVERKTLYDDIEQLRAYGMDIERIRVGQAHQYYVANRTFELAELKLLVDAVQSSKFITHRKSTELIKKVESLASVHEAQLLQRQVYVTNRIKTMNESIYYNIDAVHSAISMGRQVTFLYSEWVIAFDEGERFRKQFRKDGRRYVISPWALIWDDEYYYMLGYDSQAGIIKHYRVDKMSRIEIEESVREGKEQFDKLDLAVYTRGVFGMFGGGEETVRIKIANHLIGAIVDRFGEDVFISREDDEHFIVSVDVSVSPHFLSWVFGFGRDAVIISPEHVVNEFVNYTNSVISMYRK
ncbi:MAG: WYL domain-containing transcriptional regulator [Clostridiales bacterium]|jgi:predicted DNA-binding transcriptional regulator YafY|nr:WYL domain-containing transcriptional regulator [Clostridiales bacterium]